MRKLNDFINEARDTKYTVQFIGVEGKDGMPFSVEIIVPLKHREKFEEFLENEQDNIFAHAEGAFIEY